MVLPHHFDYGGVTSASKRNGKMKQSIFRLLLALLLSIPVSLFATPQQDYKPKQLKLIAQMTAQLLSRNHYRQHPLDEKISSMLFDEYFKTLDPNKIYFTTEDVEKFEPEREKLGAALLRGDTSFAFRVYELYRNRNSEFRTFAEEQLKTPYDFSGNETFIADRRDLPRATNQQELEKLWNLRLKNDVLSYRLFNRARNEASSKENPEEDKSVGIAKIWEAKKPEQKVLTRLRDINNDIMKKEDIDILGIYLNALAQVYGPHSNYLAPKLEEDQEINMKLSLTGIGITLTSDDGYIKIVSIVPGGPAALDGRLKVEDRIIGVTPENGELVDVVDMPVAKAVNFIRGPENTKVTLTVIPGEKGRNGVPQNITLTRAKVALVDSEAKGEVREVKRPDGSVAKVGVITLPSFYRDFEAEIKGDAKAKKCSDDVARILEDFKTQGVVAVVMDLRRNGGGSLPEAISLSGLFIPSGPVVQIRSSDRKVHLESDDDSRQIYNGPLVILTSKLSASATEIFAAALRDCERAVLVGDSRTFGKGTVLNVMQLDRFLKFIGENFDAGSAIYETAMFYRIAGGSVQQLGIVPDIQLPSLTEELEIGEMFMDNHLPWDTIKPVPFKKFNPEHIAKIPALTEASKARIATSPEYQNLLRKIELFRKYKDKKEVSLNEDARWREYQEEKQVQDESERLYQEDSDGKVGKKQADPELDETVNIAADLAA